MQYDSAAGPIASAANIAPNDGADLADAANLPDIPDTASAIPIAVAIGPFIEAPAYSNLAPESFAAFCETLRIQSRAGDKDGLCFLPGTLIDDSKPKRGSNRGAKNVATLSAMVFDLDAGQEVEDVCRSLEDAGFAALLYPSYNNGASATKLDSRDKYIEEAAKAGAEIDSVEFARAYLIERRKLTPAMAATITEVEDAITAIKIHHAPNARFRVVIPLIQPFELAAKGAIHTERQKQWKRFYAAVGDKLGFFYDLACADVARAFYTPSRPKGKPDKGLIYIPGNALDLSAIELPDEPERKTAKAKAGGEKTVAEIDGRKIDIARFWMSGGKTLNVATALEDHDSEAHTHKRSGFGLNCACPFEEEHPKADNRFWCVDAQDSDNGNFHLKCQHSTCATRDKFEFVKAFIETGRLTLEALEDHQNYALEEGADFAPVLRALGIDPRGPEPEPLLPPEIEVSDPFASFEEAMALVDEMKTKQLVNEAIKIAQRVGAARMPPIERTQVLTKIAKRTGLKKSDLEDQMELARPHANPAHEKWLLQGIEADRREAAGPGYEFLEGTNYSFSKGKICEMVRYGDRVEYVPICNAFQVPFKSADQEAKRPGLVLQFDDPDGNMRETIVGLGELHRDSPMLRERLADLGLNPVPGAKLEKMLSEVYDKVPTTIRNFTRCGWHGAKTFAAPNGSVISTDPAMKGARVAKSACWKEQGSPGDAETGLAAVERLSEIDPSFAFSFCVGLAGPLVPLLNEPINRGGNNTGVADAGKTSNLQVAASVWSSPVAGKGAVQPALGTLNGFEAVAKIAHGTYLAIDETKLIKDDRDFSKLAFMLAQGQEKRRTTVKSELRDSASWSMTFSISSERNSRQMGKDAGEEIVAGQYRRVVDVIFEKGDAHDEHADEVKEILTQVLPSNWGHAGPASVRYLIESGLSADPKEIADELSRQKDKLVAGVEIAPGMRDASTLFALANTAAIVFERGGVITPAIKERCLSASDRFWKRFAGTEEAKALDPGKRAVESFLHYLIANIGRTGHAVGAEMEDDVRKVAATVYWYDANRFVIPRAKLGEIIGNVPEEAFLKALKATECLRYYSKSQGGERVSKATFWPPHPDDWGPFAALIIDRAKMGFHLTGTKQAESDPLGDDAGGDEAAPVKRGDLDKLAAFAKADAKRR